MEWLAFVVGVLSLAAAPLIWVVVHLRRRRARPLVTHDTTPPTPIQTTGQRR